VSEAHDRYRPDEEAFARAASRARIVQDFSRSARGAADLPQLRASLLEAVWALGFDYVLLQGPDSAIWLADLPPAWHRPRAAEGDAVLAAGVASFAPFLWSDIPRLAALSDAQQEYLSDAVAAGVGAAVCVPIHRPRPANEAGSYSRFAGLCSFLMRNGMALPLESLAAAHYIGAQAFDASERLRHVAAQPDPFRRVTPRLTPRQRDCVVLVAQGKSDWEIGRLLGISESTVHKHIEDAKRRFGVSTRIQLVVRSLFDAKLTFADVIAPDESQALANSTCTTSVRATAKVAAQIPR